MKPVGLGDVHPLFQAESATLYRILTFFAVTKAQSAVLCIILLIKLQENFYLL